MKSISEFSINSSKTMVLKTVIGTLNKAPIMELPTLIPNLEFKVGCYQLVQ